MAIDATQHHVWQMAKVYHEVGFSVIPCRADKRPSGQWQEYTVKRASNRLLDRWFDELSLPSIGLIGGRISDNIVFIDLDGIPAVQMFFENFPDICKGTKSVLTGSQQGIHLYVRCIDLPDNTNVRVQDVGGFEIRGNGQYVIAPPSPHPSGNTYSIYRDKPIMTRDNLDDVYEWMQSLRLSKRHNQNDAIAKASRPQNVTIKAGNKPVAGKKVVKNEVGYINQIISDEIAKVQIAPKGTQNNTLYKTALKLASLSAGGYVVWSEINARLLGASNLPYSEKTRTIESAYRTGSQNPRELK